MGTRLRPFVLRLLALALAACSAAGIAAPIGAPTPPRASATVMKPLTVIKKADLDFGNVVVAGAGTATVDPVTGAVTTTGLVSSAGALGRRALFTATGSRNSVVLIRLPKNPIALTRIGGTETLSVSSWTLDGTTNRRVPPSLAFDFGVGATVTVPAGQADGTYVGTFSVDVQYP